MSSYNWLRLATDWIPFLVFVGLLIYFGRKLTKGPYSQKSQNQFMREYCQEHLAETKRLNEILERIALVLEKRPE